MDEFDRTNSMALAAVVASVSLSSLRLSLGEKENEREVQSVTLEFFYLQMSEEGGGGVARTPDRPRVENVKDLAGTPQPAILFVVVSGECQDYLANDLGWPLMSARLKSVVCRAVAQNSPRWIQVSVQDAEQAFHTYFIPYFPDEFDVLDVSRSIFAA